MVDQYASVTDYVGRQVDVAAFKGWKPGTHKQVTQELVLPGKHGESIAGIEKLLQRFTIELFTEAGSLTYLPLRGSRFMTEARMGYWRTGGDVRSSFSGAMLDVSLNLSNEEAETDPDDERFTSAELLSVSLFGDKVTLTVKVTSRAGTSFEALLPLTVTSN
jgi:hypothetical protein